MMQLRYALKIVLTCLLTTTLNFKWLSNTCSASSLDSTQDDNLVITDYDKELKEKLDPRVKINSTICGKVKGDKSCDEENEEVEKKVEVSTTSWYPRPSTTSFNYHNLPNKGINYELASPCKRPAQCEPFLVNVSTCFGAVLPHRLTTVELIGRNITQYYIQKELLKWHSSLKNIPKCWAMIQTLLCAVYMPRCENGMVDLPSQDMCRAIRGPCRVVEQTVGWPSFLRCDSDNFPTNCKAEPRELRFNTTGKCPPFLVPTDVSRSWYDGWDGCGLQCHTPWFTQEERADVHMLIRIVGTLCLLCSLLTVLTFFIDWRSANKYPPLIIFYINGCFLIITIGFMAQFTAGARDDIVCRKDGILRKSEPSSGENLACVIVFVLIYYFLMAASIWFVILSYSWYMSFKALGKIREAIDAKAAYFHLIAWSLPLMLTIAILALAEVDGDSINGICFVGYENVYMRVGFVLIPIFACVCVGSYLLIKGLIVLIKLKLGSDDIISLKASSKIRETIVRLVLFTIVIFTIVLVTFICHLYDYSGRTGWDDSLRRFIMCNSNLTTTHFDDNKDVARLEQCQLKHRPNITAIQIQLITLFGAGIFMCTWICNPSTVETWRRFFRRTFRQSSHEPAKMTKHKMIAKAFARRKDINGGRMSFSFQSTHDDPLGMNFDLNSAVSLDISSNWQAVLPKFIARRGAFDDGKDARRNSSASDFSQMTSNESQGNRRHSLDSQISYHMSEQEMRQYMANARLKRRKRRKGFKRKSRNSRVVPVMGVANLNHPRRGSDTSQHSDFGHLIPHHLLPAKVENIDQSATVGNHMIDRSNIGHARMSFRMNSGVKGDGEMANLTVESVSMQMPGLLLVNNNNEAVTTLMEPALDDEQQSFLSDSETMEQLECDELSNDENLSAASSDSQSDIELKSLGSNRSFRILKKKSSKETGLVDKESTVVDMNMDDDNRDSLSS